MLQNDRWASADVEPALADMLSDPVVEAVMLADGVCVEDVLAAIRHSARTRFSSSFGSFGRGAT